MTPEKNITLYFKEGGSDKVYQAQVVPDGVGYLVNFQYGRRGASLTAGSKTATPVALDKAMKVYEKLVQEKMSKGYTQGVDGTPYVGTDKEFTGILPQLLNPIDESQVEAFITSDDWWMQEKFDGRRILIKKVGNEITGINKKGIAVALQQEYVDAALKLEGDFLLDGEPVNGIYNVFDVLELTGTDLRPETYKSRRRHLMELLVKEPFLLAATAMSEASKREMLAKMRAEKREGVVFKRHDAAYTPGRPASGGNQRKLKFYETASCIVSAVNGTKRSVALTLTQGIARIGVGNCTIPSNWEIPAPGTVVEIRYLYAYKGGSLYQPTYLGPRDDVDASECTMSQLKLKAEGEDDE